MFCISLVLFISAVPRVWAEPAGLAAVDADAMSGDPARIRRSIDAYRALDTANAEVQWRLIRAYFNYYDELAEKGRKADQQWATDAGYAAAAAFSTENPDKPELTYYYATIGLCYLDFHRFKAVFLVNDLLRMFAKVQKVMPEIDDGGPDRNLGILYHELPGWPIGIGDKKKALKHLEAAVSLAPRRAANRLTLASFLGENKRYEEGWTHIQFVREGKFKVSSEHWRQIYLRRVEEVAKDYPQFGK